MEKVGGLAGLSVSDVEISESVCGGSAAKKPAKRVDSLGRSYATGKRKSAIARVWLRPGTGKFIVNQREVQVYFARAVLRMLMAQPFNLTGRLGQFDVFSTVSGGGLSGQAGALRHVGLTESMHLLAARLGWELDRTEDLIVRRTLT